MNFGIFFFLNRVRISNPQQLASTQIFVKYPAPLSSSCSSRVDIYTSYESTVCNSLNLYSKLNYGGLIKLALRFVKDCTLMISVRQLKLTFKLTKDYS